MKIKNQRLRQLTTGLLHTDVAHIYEDIEEITDERGIMTHMIPRAVRALKPYLQTHLKDPRFWDGAFDQTHDGETELLAMSAEDRAAFFDRYTAQPDPLDGKEIITVITDRE